MYRLFELHRQEKGEAAKRAVNAMISEPKSLVFNATFVDIYRTFIRAENWSDDNIIDSFTFAAIKKAPAEIKFDNLIRPLEFEIAVVLFDCRKATLLCSKVMTIDVEIHIRHGFLHLRGVCWLVSDQIISEAPPGRPVLEFPGLNARDILDSAAEKYSGIVKVPKILSKNSEPKAKVVKILKGVYHSGNGVDGADFNDEDGWIDLGPEDPGKRHNGLDSKVSEANSNGMSSCVQVRLRKILTEFENIIKMNLYKGDPADIALPKVNLNPGATSISSKQ